jgi:hypothetical protein
MPESMPPGHREAPGVASRGHRADRVRNRPTAKFASSLVVLTLAGALVGHTARATMPTAMTGPSFVGKPFTVRLDDPKITGTREDGRAVFRNRSTGSVRVVITTRSDASGARALIFGGRTPGITFPRTDCDVVALNVDPSADRPDRGFPRPIASDSFAAYAACFSFVTPPSGSYEDGATPWQ